MTDQINLKQNKAFRESIKIFAEDYINLWFPDDEKLKSLTTDEHRLDELEYSAEKFILWIMERTNNVILDKEEYGELLNDKKLNKKLVPYFKQIIKNLKIELAACESVGNPDEMSGYLLTHKAKLEEKIAELEELLK